MLLLLVSLLAVEAPIAGDDARAVVDRWLAAQNAGDLAAYEALFASRFTGVRRSGPRTVRFDRAGWLRDRKRMFAKPMAVDVTDVSVHASGTAALVSFTQAFAQGTFRDSGPKQLVIVREAGALKIASEQMLQSRVLSSPVARDERFRWVTAGAVLLSSEPDEKWATGAGNLKEGDPLIVSKAIDAARLPPELARWRGRRMLLFDAKGTVCEATINSFRMMSRVIPHFGTRQVWKELKPDVVTAQAWELGAKILVGDLDTPCGDAMWAQPATLGPVAIDSGAEADAATRARVVAHVRRSPEWQATQTAYRGQPVSGVKRWDELPDGQTRVSRFRAKVAGRDVTLLSVTLSYGQDRCGLFGADLWALYEERNGKLVQRNTPGQNTVRPASFVDSDGDGNSELLYLPFPDAFGTEKGRLLLDAGGWNQREEVYVPFMDCPC